MEPVGRVRTDDGVELAVYDFGGPSFAAPPLLLAHATGFHARCWLPVVSILRQHFHCYAFDERAHGDSTSPPNGDFHWHRFADDALAVIDHFGLDRTFAVGHSCGGALLMLAEIFRPGTFRALYCFEPVVIPVDTPPPPGSTPPNPLAEGARRRRQEFPSYDAALVNFATKPPMSGFDPAGLDAYVRYGFEALSDGRVRLKCRGEDEARTYENAHLHSAYARLSEVRCPVTLACGELTNAFGVDVLTLDAARLPSARIEVLPGLTHFGPMEAPGMLANTIIAAFSAG
jgi:pimeloyl-ACP methyl ester carboxylesterase